jgi:cytochrome c oxidase subunit IV
MATETEKTDQVEDSHSHPSRATYLEIAAILAVMTVMEVLLYVFRDALGRGITTPALIVLTIGKFILVGAWFMHLRFDHPVLRRVFAAGIALAVVVFAVVAADWFLGAAGGSF